MFLQVRQFFWGLQIRLFRAGLGGWEKIKIRRRMDIPLQGLPGPREVCLVILKKKIESQPIFWVYRPYQFYHFYETWRNHFLVPLLFL